MLTCSPAGLACNVIWAVFGNTSTKVVLVRPPESVTVRCIRYQTTVDVSPVFGMTNDPLETPLNGAMNSWVWTLWWNTISHVKALGGRFPSSWSVPVPA